MIITKEFVEFYNLQAILFCRELKEFYTFYHSSNTTYSDIQIECQKIVRDYDFLFYGDNKLYFENLERDLKNDQILNNFYKLYIFHLFDLYGILEYERYALFADEYAMLIALNKVEDLSNIINEEFDFLKRLIDDNH